MPTDRTTTLADLRTEVQAFIDQRDWRQFHSPKNLSMSIAIEAAELMEHFQWICSKDATAEVPSPADLQQIREELADIVCYVLSFANVLDIDISTALRDKLVKNAEKYPVERYRGRFR